MCSFIYNVGGQEARDSTDSSADLSMLRKIFVCAGLTDTWMAFDIDMCLFVSLFCSVLF